MDETRRDWTPRPVSAVYLKGDPQPIVIDLTTDALLAKLADAVNFAGELAPPALMFVRLPSTRSMKAEALVRPDCISAILPATYGSDDDDD